MNKKKKSLILIVDDIPKNLQVLGSVLRVEGYEIAIAMNGKQALKIVEDILPDLILLDVMMPELDGYETCEILKKSRRTKDIPVIFLTAKTETEDIARGFELGAVDYINKPFKSVELLARVKTHIDLKKSKEELEKSYQRLQDDLDIASVIQGFLLPKSFIITEKILFSSLYIPSTKIGGDLFDVIPISDSKFIVYIADISGHGIQAALIMTAVKSIISMIIEKEKETLELHKIISRLNKILDRNLFRNNYMTMMLCLIDFEENIIKSFSAGHPPMAQYDLIAKKAEFIAMEKGSIPIGWLEDYDYSKEEEHIKKLDDNKIYFLYSDGIFECENQDEEQLGMEGILEFLEKNITENDGLLIPHKISKGLQNLGYDLSKDDFTQLCFRTKISKANFLAGKLKRNKSGRTAIDCEQIIFDNFKDKDFAQKVEIGINNFIDALIQSDFIPLNDNYYYLQILSDSEMKFTLYDFKKDWNLQKIIEKDTNGISKIYKLSSKVKKTRFANINATEIFIKYKK